MQNEVEHNFTLHFQFLELDIKFGKLYFVRPQYFCHFIKALLQAALVIIAVK
jgi:hypothetical protein